MDLGEREVPEAEADATAQPALDPLDLSIRLPRIGALVVAVLEDEMTDRRTADVVNLLFDHDRSSRTRGMTSLP